MHTSPNGTRYLTLDDVTAVLPNGDAPRPRSASGYGEIATAHRVRCAVGDDARILTRRVYVLAYGNSGSPFVYGTVSGERQRFYLDTVTEHTVQDLAAAGVTWAPITNLDVRNARDLDALAGGVHGGGYAQRLRFDGSPRGPLCVHTTSRPDDRGRPTREGRLFIARRAYDVGA
ncbi:hypothetical protein KNU78_gp89 [Gordonia phage Sukkupi]|uniref:Uncharacterized protein n=1 Tax=Gordonia phage Sukkupi TaxID=2653747 RepID=A0A5Q2WLF5_9CAUD|nr:hypothetical protein KNU78_gp89 [Gordonia phage Sukkupi]QGH79332.1 hypothetical protein SEA_SUKKUPI_89 [Gordonia phage Sukkupi]QGH80804.1 hypothetical protein SEA_YNDEXA_89 [Gordonia phage Yndexa]